MQAKAAVVRLANPPTAGAAPPRWMPGGRTAVQARMTGPPRHGVVQCNLRIGTSVYTPEDGGVLFDKVHEACFSNSVPVITRNLSHFLNSGLAFSGMADFVRALNTRILGQINPRAQAVREIPKRIIQYWAGGTMQPSALQNVKAWITRAKQAGWEHWMLTDFAINKAFSDRVIKSKVLFITLTTSLSDQLNELEKAGSRVINMNGFGSARYAALSERTIKSRDFDLLPFMSDLARFRALYDHGGLYVDVDVAPGGIALDQFHSVSDVPALGPMLRTSQDVRDSRLIGKVGSAREQRLLAMFGKDDDRRGMQYMMTPARSPVMREIYDIAEGKGASSTGVLGNVAVMSGIANYFNRNFGETALNNILTLTVPPQLGAIDWVTAESDNTVN